MKYPPHNFRQQKYLNTQKHFAKGHIVGFNQGQAYIEQVGMSSFKFQGKDVSANNMLDSAKRYITVWIYEIRRTFF